MPSPYAIMNCGEKLFGHGCEVPAAHLLLALCFALWLTLKTADGDHGLYFGFDHDPRGTSPPIHILSVTNLQTEHMSRF